MKIIDAHKTVTIKMYVAKDGRMFDDRDSCLEYEKGLSNYYDIPCFGMKWDFDPDGCYNIVWYLLRCVDDFNSIWDEKLYDADDIFKEDWCPKQFPCWICVFQTQPADGYGYVLGTLNDVDKIFNTYRANVTATMECIERNLNEAGEG